MSIKTKILLTVGIYPPEIGGPASYVFSLANWSKNRGLDVAVATASNYKMQKSSFNVYNVKKKFKLLWHAIFFLMTLKKIKNYDVIYINGLFIESAFAALLKNKRYFVRIPGDQIWERWINKEKNNLNIDQFQHYKGSLKIRFLRQIRKLYLHKAEKVIAPSKYLADIIEGWGIDKKKIEVINNPYLEIIQEQLNLSLFNKSFFNVVTGGRLVKWKGVDAVIRACKNLNGVNLIIVGDGTEKKKLMELVKSLRMKERVFFTGIISRGQLKTVFMNSGCFVLNSKYEGLPHIVLEAMYSNCPVAISNAGGNIEVVDPKKNGTLFNVDEIDMIKNAILKYKENQSFTGRIVKEAKLKIEKNFNQSIQFEKTLEILKS